jgi:hypothetical protein
VLNSVATSRDSGVLIKRDNTKNAFMGYDEPSHGFVFGLTDYNGIDNSGENSIDDTSDNFMMPSAKVTCGDLHAIDGNFDGSLNITGSHVHLNNAILDGVSKIGIDNPENAFIEYDGDLKISSKNGIEINMDSDNNDSPTNFLLKDNGKTLLDINQDGFMTLKKIINSSSYSPSSTLSNIKNILNDPTFKIDTDFRNYNGITLKSNDSQPANKLVSFINFMHDDPNNNTMHSYGSLVAMSNNSDTLNTGRLSFVSYPDGSINNMNHLNEAFTINHDGHIGVGVTNPDDELEISGNAHIHDILNFTDGNTIANKINLRKDSYQYHGFGIANYSVTYMTSIQHVFYYNGSTNKVIETNDADINLLGKCNISINGLPSASSKELEVGGDISASGEIYCNTYHSNDNASDLTIQPYHASNTNNIILSSYKSSIFRNQTTDADVLIIDHSNNKIGIGTSTTGTSEELEVSGNIHLTGTLISDSDIRLKTNIRTIEGALESIDKIRGCRFNRNDVGNKGEEFIGVIAQEVEEVYPELIKTNPETDKKMVNYSGLGPILIECVKSLKSENELLRQDKNNLEKRLSTLEAKVEKLLNNGLNEK